MPQVAKKKATAAEKDIAHFSSVIGAMAVFLPSGVCSREHSLTAREGDITVNGEGIRDHR